MTDKIPMFLDDLSPTDVWWTNYCSTCKHVIEPGRYREYGEKPKCGVQNNAEIDEKKTTNHCSNYEKKLDEHMFADVKHLYDLYESECFRFGGCKLKDSTYCVSECLIYKFLHDLKDFESYDVRENIRATWLKNGEKYNCSNCYHEEEIKTNYCSYCGAEMHENKYEKD